MTEDLASAEIDNIRKGSTVTCTIAVISDSGLDVTVGNNIKGFIKKSDLARERNDQRTDRYGVGDKVDATVTNIDKKARKIALSIKAKEIEEGLRNANNTIQLNVTQTSSNLFKE